MTKLLHTYTKANHDKLQCKNNNTKPNIGNKAPVILFKNPRFKFAFGKQMFYKEYLKLFGAQKVYKNWGDCGTVGRAVIYDNNRRWFECHYYYSNISTNLIETKPNGNDEIY